MSHKLYSSGTYACISVLVDFGLAHVCLFLTVSVPQNDLHCNCRYMEDYVDDGDDDAARPTKHSVLTGGLRNFVFELADGSGSDEEGEGVAGGR